MNIIFSESDLLAIDLPVRGYHPFPRYEERDAWRAIPPETARMWIDAAEAQLAFQWPPITAGMYLTLRTTGELKPHWDRFRERRSALGILALAECMEGEGRFIEQILNGIVAICEETAWISPLATKRVGFDLPLASDWEVDLCSSETAMSLALYDYLLGDRLALVSPRVRGRLRSAVREQVLQPYLDREDYWWMGFTKDRINNWNPWCNMNVLLCFLLIEEDAAVRAKGFHKALRSLDRYIETYMPDGCCDEGPMYWGAAGAGLFQCLELLYEASGGQLNFYGLEKIRSIGQYIAKVHIDGEWFVNFADGDAHVFLDSATYRFGKALGDEGMMALGARAKPIRPAVYEWFHTYQHLQDLFMAREREACALELPYLGEAWLWHTGVMTVRERAGSPKGLFLAAKAGHNLESHNHNDVGSFIVYADGSPALIDIGTEEYSVKTFSAQRFDIWYTQSQYHNCPGVRGVLQQEGRAHCAKDVEHRSGEWGSALSMELRDAYPEEAGIASWRREVALKRDPGMVTVMDWFALHAPTDAVCRYLMTPRKPSLAPGLIVLPCEGGAVTVAYDADACAATVEDIPITESRLHWNWGDRLYRIILRERAPVLSAERTLVIRQA